MAIEAARRHLAQWGRDRDILEFETSSATVELAAQAAGVEPARIAKSLTFRNGDGALMVVAAGDARTDNGRFKAAFGMKPRMLTAEEALHFTGHAVGGICPFGLATDMPVWLDVSLRRFDIVLPACGSGNSAIRLTLAELEQYAGVRGWVDVCRGWQDAEYGDAAPCRDQDSGKAPGEDAACCTT